MRLANSLGVHPKWVLQYLLKLAGEEKLNSWITSFIVTEG